MYQGTYNWDNDHLYSFFIDNKFRKSKEEYSSNPFGEGDTGIKIKELCLRRSRKFGYLFDYSDSHEFEVTVMSVKPSEETKHVAKFERFGTPPEQYEFWDD